MLMKRRAITAVLAVAVGITACLNLEEPTPPTTPQLVVHAVLNPRTLGQILLLARARTGVQNATDIVIGDDEPVNGALVTLTAPSGVVMTFSQTMPTCDCPPGYYAIADSQSVANVFRGSTYTLHVRTPSGEDASGTTTIPSPRGAVTAVGKRVFSRTSDTLRLSWPRAPGARSYEFVLGTSVRPWYRTFTDTSLTIAGDALTIQGDDVFPSGADFAFVVLAVDANYYDYYRAQSDPFAGAAPSHLFGAVGVFGSVVPIVTGELVIR
jgi:hypothetical protein